MTKSPYWSHVNDLFAFQTTEKLIHKPEDICQAFNVFFTSVHTLPGTYSESPPPYSLPIPELSPITINLSWLTKALLALNPHKAPGPDAISPRVLQATASSLAPPLLRVMNSSLANGTLPVDWKLSQITPVFKSGKRSDIKNYRPVALTSIIWKVLERAVADNINDHVTSLCLANPQQHGFTAHKSCVTQLTNIIHDWTSILDRPRPPRIDAIFLDFSKAFDIMPHHTLLEKLACNFNIRGPTWTWLKSFLIGRQQRVIYHSCFSSWTPVTSGVPKVVF